MFVKRAFGVQIEAVMRSGDEDDTSPVGQHAFAVPPAAAEAAEHLEGRGVQLHLRSTRPAAGTAVAARLAILPGYGDHAGRYIEFMRWMSARGVACHALDFRGHGLSTGRRAYVNRWEEFLDDLTAFLAHPQVSPAATDRPPLFVLGHSHGGLVAAAAGERGMLAGVAGCVLTSPFLRRILPVPLAKRVAGRVADWFVPWVTMPTGLRAENMTSDAAMVTDSRADPLLLRVATPRWFFQTIRAQRRVIAAAGSFRVPLLCLVGDADDVADPADMRRFVEDAGSEDKTLRSYPGHRHELLRETGREAIFAEVLRWIGARAAGKSSK